MFESLFKNFKLSWMSSDYYLIEGKEWELIIVSVSGILQGM